VIIWTYLPTFRDSEQGEHLERKAEGLLPRTGGQLFERKCPYLIRKMREASHLEIPGGSPSRGTPPQCTR
jgi:hypothetical protein